MKLLRAALCVLASGAIGATPPPCIGAECEFINQGAANRPHIAPGVENATALVPWFTKLRAAGRPASTALHILQIGDSHTAGDVMTSAWRSVIRARYASGGRGMLAPGRPYDGYITQGVSATMSPGWSIASTFGKTWSPGHPALGLSSYSLTSRQSGATLGIAADDAADLFDRVVVCALRSPSAGQLRIDVGDGEPRLIDLAGMASSPRCETFSTPVARSRLTITAEAGPVTLTSIGTFRDAGGVALSNVGVVGSQLVHFARTDDAVVAEELRAYRPDLIVLAFGTNEGFTPRFDATEYERVLIAQILRLRRLSAAPVPILLLGPPDALSQQAILRTNADGRAIDCPVQSLSLPDLAAPLAARGNLFVPPALTQVARIQRAVARRLGVAFWDWQERMGGPCTARAWVNSDPPLMRRDYVHFRNAGGQIIADTLAADLAAAAH